MANVYLTLKTKLTSLLLELEWQVRFEAIVINSSTLLKLIAYIFFLFASGLAAAYTIENSSDKLYVLLEAKDKVGGKIQAAFEDDTGLGITVEDGANWIGGYSPNPMFNLAVEFGLRVFQVDFLNLHSFTKNGQRIEKGRIKRALNKFDPAYYDCVSEAGHQIYTDFLSGIVTPDISVQVKLAECGWVPRNAIEQLF